MSELRDLPRDPIGRIFQSDPKPARRLRADKRERQQLRMEKLGPCRGCAPETLSPFPVTIHHLVPRSLGGDDVADNLIPLCGDGSTGCHGLWESGWPADEARIVTARIRASLSAGESGYVVRKKGEVFLDRYYPKGDLPC